MRYLARTMQSLTPIVKITLAILFFCTPTATPAANSSTNSIHFFFAQITDTHLGTYRHEEVLEPILDMIKTTPLPLTCLVHTGDIAADNLDDTNNMAQGVQLLRDIKLPVHFLPGNHDILEKRTTPTFTAYTNLFGPISHSAEYHGVVFLFFFSEPLRTPVKVENYTPLKWLATELKKAGSKPVILFQHSPPVDDFYDNKLRPGWPDEIRKRWETLVNSANVKAVICGHFHRDELHWIGKVPVYVAPPVARFYRRQPSFRIYEYRDGLLSYRTEYLEK